MEINILVNGQVVFRPAEVIVFISKGTGNHKNQFSLILAHFMIFTYIGVMKYASGDIYEGEFYHGFMFGYGKYTYADGGYYEGEFRCMILFSNLAIHLSKNFN